ncbi:hypothetical protein BM221_003805 [Beauveria bassiana]|uniref:Uncharacterized protein n=1 Tax=Beauveria bassiana TaxID=176275 RepID=A0A2N6NVN2_BEABA|nr:hypothetical protein BM221_003805 [Beauveria bassiana]
MPDASSNSLKSLDDFRMKNMQMQGVPPSVYMQHQQHQQSQKPPQQGSSQGNWQMYNVHYMSQLPKGGEACLSDRPPSHAMPSMKRKKKS